EHDPPAIHPVAHRAPQQEEEHLGPGDGDPDETEGAGGVRHEVDLPGQRHQEDAVAEEGDRHTGHQQEETTVPERSRQLDPLRSRRRNGWQRRDAQWRTPNGGGGPRTGPVILWYRRSAATPHTAWRPSSSADIAWLNWHQLRARDQPRSVISRVGNIH